MKIQMHQSGEKDFDIVPEIEHYHHKGAYVQGYVEKWGRLETYRLLCDSEVSSAAYG